MSAGSLGVMKCSKFDHRGTVLCNFFPFGHAACGILVSRSGREPAPSAVKAPSPDRGTAEALPELCALNG